MKQHLRMAFLGCGYAARIHSKTLAGFPGLLRYYASRDKSKAESFAAKVHGQGAFDSYQSAITSPDIDGIFIATPPAQHLDQTVAALETGKWVIVEKPPFLKASDFDLVRQKLDSAGGRLFVAENYFYKPLAYRLRNLLSSGIIGELLFLHVNALKKQNVGDWRADPKLAGGGALFEGGIHWVNFVANLGLELKSVRGYQPAPARQFEKSIFVALRYQNGPVGALYYSWETPSLLKGLRLSKIYGSEGSITFESNGLFIFVRGSKKRIILPGLRDIAGYRAMFRDFFTCIRENREAEFNLNMAKRDLKLIESIYASM